MIDSAWEDFEKTGRIDSYLKYKKEGKKDVASYKVEIGEIEGDNVGEISKSKGNSN